MDIDWNVLGTVLKETGLVHLGFVTVALAYLVRDVLHLRVLAVVGYALFLADGVRMLDTETSTVQAWHAFFLLANAVHAFLLHRQRRREHLTTEEQTLYDVAFPSLTVGAARRLMRCGRFETLPDGQVLTSQGREGSAIHAIVEGTIEILVDDEPVTVARPGQLIGEIGFLAGGCATATAVATRRARVLTWQRDKLERRMGRSPDLHDAVYAAFGRDLARKVAEQSLRPRRP